MITAVVRVVFRVILLQGTCTVVAQTYMDCSWFDSDELSYFICARRALPPECKNVLSDISNA